MLFALPMRVKSVFPHLPQVNNFCTHITFPKYLSFLNSWTQFLYLASVNHFLLNTHLPIQSNIAELRNISHCTCIYKIDRLSCDAIDWTLDTNRAPNLRYSKMHKHWHRNEWAHAKIYFVDIFDLIIFSGYEHRSWRHLRNKVTQNEKFKGFLRACSVFQGFLRATDHFQGFFKTDIQIQGFFKTVRTMDPVP